MMCLLLFFPSSFYWCSCKSAQNLWIKSVLLSCPLRLACRRRIWELERNRFHMFLCDVLLMFLRMDAASEKYHPRGTSNTPLITCHVINAEKSAPLTGRNHSALESRQQIGSILRGSWHRFLIPGLIFSVNETCLSWITSVAAQTKVYISEFITCDILWHIRASQLYLDMILYGFFIFQV